MSSEGQLFKLISDFGSGEGRVQGQSGQTANVSDDKSNATVAGPMTRQRAGRAAGTGKLEAGPLTDILLSHTDHQGRLMRNEDRVTGSVGKKGWWIFEETMG